MPKLCYHLHQDDQRQVIALIENSPGFFRYQRYATPREAACEADALNAQANVSHAECELMLVRSLFPKGRATLASFRDAGPLSDRFPEAGPARSAPGGAARAGSGGRVGGGVALHGRALNTVLAALRVVQRSPAVLRTPEIDDIATCGETATALDADEIDALCEALNGPEPEVIVTVRGGVASIAWASPGIATTVLDFDEFESCGCDPVAGALGATCTAHTPTDVAAFAETLSRADAVGAA